MMVKPAIKPTATTIFKAFTLTIALTCAPALLRTADGAAFSTETESRAIGTLKLATTVLPPSSDSTDAVLNAANAAFFSGNFEAASEYCLHLLGVIHGKGAKSASADPSEEMVEVSSASDARILINLGSCFLGMKQYARAEKWFEHAEKVLDKAKSTDALAIADCKLGLAECHYMQGRGKQSLKDYSGAVESYQKTLGLMHPDVVPAVEGLAGSYYIEGDFKSALPLYEHVARIDLAEKGPTDLRTGLSLNSLAEIYYQLNDCENSRKMFEQAFWIFKKHNADRLLRQAETVSSGTADTDAATMRKRINDVVLGTTNLPDIAGETLNLLKSDDFDGRQMSFEMRPKNFENWRVARRNVEESLFISIDPSVNQKGILVCLHGLGLNSKSFKDFSAKITPFGYGVIALDVRGFGSFAMEKGLDKLDLDTGLEDLAASVSLIKAHSPGLPIIVLGESMGGALAVQLAAKHPELVNALISAVPSSKRFKSTQTNLLVGLKLIEGKKKPIEIGKRVIEQSTADESVRAVWMNDPGNRLQLSAEELVRFQNFMKETEKVAKDVKAIPAIIFQGFRDHLVKPEGTIALYGALGTPQKDLVLVGDSEHLIFEEGQAPDDIVRMLAGWLDSHIAVKEKLRPSPNPVPDAVTSGSVNTSSD